MKYQLNIPHKRVLNRFTVEACVFLIKYTRNKKRATEDS